MTEKLSYPGIQCPECGYALEGLSGRVCPECGSKFSPAWLYSAEYVYSIRWTLLRIAVAVFCVAALVVGGVLLVAGAGDGYLCVLVTVGGIGLMGLARRVLF